MLRKLALLADRRLWLFIAGCLVAAGASRALVSCLPANLARLEALQEVADSGWKQDLDGQAWDAGWLALCDADAAAIPETPVSGQETPFVAATRLKQGDYRFVQRSLRELMTADKVLLEPNAPAYLAAFNLDWVGAAKAYRPVPFERHRRFWATVFYLAAQRLAFSGQIAQAAEWYRKADSGYDALGPLRGLALADCLDQKGLYVEAFDAYRRALIDLPPVEALAHQVRFNHLRLAGLRQWHLTDPTSSQVAHWLAFYEADASSGSGKSEELAGQPQPRVPLAVELGPDRRLVGLDYRPEDIATGPFMEVDFFIQIGDGGSTRYQRIRRTVLNRVANGAFTWDAAPAGVRPIGWHKFVYDPHAQAIEYAGDFANPTRWLCVNGEKLTSGFGLASNTTEITTEGSLFLQGGLALVSNSGSLAIGRTWHQPLPGDHPYSYLGGGRLQSVEETMAGVWQPEEGVTTAAVWLLANPVGRACARDLYFFALPESL